MNRRFSVPKTLLRVLLLVPVFALCLVRARAQALETIKSPEELTRAIASLDTALFDSYNHCDLQKFASFFTDDIEFYHDQGGVTLGKQNLTESVKKNICGKVTRELVSGSLQVYPMKGYGAVEMGVHRFHHPGMTTPSRSARRVLFTFGNTKTALGKSRASSVTTTTRRRNKANRGWVRSRETYPHHFFTNKLSTTPRPIAPPNAPAIPGRNARKDS